MIALVGDVALATVVVERESRLVGIHLVLGGRRAGQERERSGQGQDDRCSATHGDILRKRSWHKIQRAGE
jgi:hypothetical protein